jgi:MFS family permease
VIDEELHRPAAFLGAVNAAKGLGSVLGGLLAMRIVRRLPTGSEDRLTVLGLTLLALGTAAMLVPDVVAVLAGGVVIGLGIPTSIVGLFTTAQQHTPQRLQGRVSGAAGSLVTTPQVVSVAIGAALIVRVDYRVLLAVVAVAVLLSAFYLAAHAARRPRLDLEAGDA